MKPLHHGRANPLSILLASVAVFSGLVAWLALGRGPATKPLLVYCAVAVKAPVEAAARGYEKAYGVRIELQFGASQTLLTNATVSHTGDLYLPADDSYIMLAREKGLLAEQIPLAIQRPVLAVKKGNPKQIRSLEDLLRPDVSLAQANPDAAAIGKVTRDILTRTGQWESIRQHTTVFTATVIEAANDVKLGAADAAFIWDAMATQYPELEIVPLPLLSGAESKLIVAVLKSSKDPAAAMRFVRYLSASDKFEEFGFTVLKESHAQ